MPLYNYVCDTCGPFEEWQNMALSSEPVSCTNCGEKSMRAMAAPALALMPATQRLANFRNEKSADHPEVVHKPKNITAEQGHGKSHGGGHTHNHGHAHEPSRPWMIGH